MAEAVLAFGITVVGTPVAIAALRRYGIVDLPNERSSHSRPTPRGGGLAPAVGIAAALATAAPVAGSTLGAVLLAIVMFGLIGLAEDLVGIPVFRRLALQTAASVTLAPLLSLDFAEPHLIRLLAAGVTVLFVVAYVNAFNFMDGINGISVAQTLVAGSAWYLVGRAEGVRYFASAGAVLAAAALAFGLYNFPRAQVFLGDVGSYAFGAALAVLALLGLRSEIAPEAVMAPLTLYLADTGTTIIRRLRRGDPWHRPHRDHTYQQLVRCGWSQTATTLFVGVLVIFVSALGAVSIAASTRQARIAADGAIVVVLAGYLAAPTLAGRSGPEPTPA